MAIPSTLKIGRLVDSPIGVSFFTLAIKINKHEIVELIIGSRNDYIDPNDGAWDLNRVLLGAKKFLRIAVLALSCCINTYTSN